MRADTHRRCSPAVWRQSEAFGAWSGNWKRERERKWDIKRQVKRHFCGTLCGNNSFSRPGVPPGGAECPAQAGSADMLPKVETESLGLSRSYGEQRRVPRNMQGKKKCHFHLLCESTCGHMLISFHCTHRHRELRLHPGSPQCALQCHQKFTCNTM